MVNTANLSRRSCSFTCNIHFLTSTYFIFNQFKSNKFCVSFAVEYMLIMQLKEVLNVGQV